MVVVMMMMVMVGGDDDDGDDVLCSRFTTLAKYSWHAWSLFEQI